MRIRESEFQTQFGKWLKSRGKETAAYELKSVETSLPFSDVAEHQIQGLWHAKHDKIYKKLEDLGIQQPFDCFMLYNVPSYVVIRYTSKHFYALDIDVFITESETSIRRSLTEERAAELAAFTDLEPKVSVSL